MNVLRRLAAVASAAACGFAVAASVAAQPTVTVVMSGLDNPRGLAFAPNGALYVAEAGRGGAGPCAPNAGGELRCYGNSGAISRLWKGRQERVAEGMPSHAAPGGFAAGGPNDIAFQGTGGAYVTLGLGGDPQYEADLGSPYLGTLIHMAASGKWRAVADVALHEFEHNPAGGPLDSNPFGALAESGARYVADAGANALLKVTADGSIETVATFPRVSNPAPPGPPLTDAVPTSVARGPDGALYVGQLTGVPFRTGLASIYRVVPGEAPTVYLTGFTTIMDIAFGPDGSLYVVEHSGGPVFFATPGRLTRVAPDGTRSVVLGGLDRPTSVAVGSDGAVYVTNHGITPGIGEVLKIAP